MGTFILLLTLTPEGQTRALKNPTYLIDAENSINVAGVQTLGIYGVLGEYDFVALLEADSNETAARFSLELGVKASVHVATLPAVPLARLEVTGEGAPEELETDVRLKLD